MCIGSTEALHIGFSEEGIFCPQESLSRSAHTQVAKEKKCTFIKLHFPQCTRAFWAGSADPYCEMFPISCPTYMEMTCVYKCLIFPLSGDLTAFGWNSDPEQWQETALINQLDIWKTASFGGKRCHEEVTAACSVNFMGEGREKLERYLLNLYFPFCFPCYCLCCTLFKTVARFLVRTNKKQ